MTKAQKITQQSFKMKPQFPKCEKRVQSQKMFKTSWNRTSLSWRMHLKNLIFLMWTSRTNPRSLSCPKKNRKHLKRRWTCTCSVLRMPQPTLQQTKSQAIVGLQPHSTLIWRARSLTSTSSEVCLTSSNSCTYRSSSEDSAWTGIRWRWSSSSKLSKMTGN